MCLAWKVHTVGGSEPESTVCCQCIVVWQLRPFDINSFADVSMFVVEPIVLCMCCTAQYTYNANCITRRIVQTNQISLPSFLFCAVEVLVDKFIVNY